jgi:hypothetical protein
MAGHSWKPRCHAMAKSTGLRCRAMAMANGTCRVHGGLTPNPRTAVLTDAGRERIKQAQRARWQHWREAGSPSLARKNNEPVATAEAPRPQKTNEQGRKLSDAEFLKA